MKKTIATLATVATSAGLWAGALACIFIAPTKADAAGMTLRQAQWEMCDAGKMYANDVSNGYMTRRQAIREAAEYAVYLQQENGLAGYGNSPLSSAAEHGMLGGNCNIYR